MTIIVPVSRTSLEWLVERELTVVRGAETKRKIFLQSAHNEISMYITNMNEIINQLCLARTLLCRPYEEGALSVRRSVRLENLMMTITLSFLIRLLYYIAYGNMDTMLPNNVGQGHIYSSFFPLRLLLFYYVKASEDDRTV